MDEKPKSEMSNQEIAEGLVLRMWNRLRGTSESPQRESTAHLSNQEIAERIVQRIADRINPKSQDTQQSADGARRMDIDKFSRQAIENYKENARSMGQEEAKRQAVYASAASASDENRVPINGAAKAARHAIESYETNSKGGLSDEKAMESAARDTANRFDDRARDLAKNHSQDRPKSRGIGL